MKCVRKISARSQIRAGLSGYIAELGASFIGAIVGFKVDEREDHAAYIEHWLELWRGEHNWSNREVSIM